MSQTRKEQRAEAAAARRVARDQPPAKQGGPANQAARKPSPVNHAAPEGRLRYRATADRPPGLFGNWPVSELIIVVGVIIFIAGFSKGPSHGGESRIVAGIALCAIGVLEFTIREHITGYRSHTVLLAGVPAVVIHGLVLLVAPKGSALLYVVLVPDMISYALAFQVLRGAYKRAETKREMAVAAGKDPYA